MNWSQGHQRTAVQQRTSPEAKGRSSNKDLILEITPQTGSQLIISVPRLATRQQYQRGAGGQIQLEVLFSSWI